MNASQRAITQGILVFLVLAVGVGAMVVLYRTRPVPQRTERTDDGVLVDVQVVGSSRQRLAVPAQGTVMPARQVVMMPEVSGRVVWQSDELVPGGRFQAGAPIIRLDARDYSLQVRQQQSVVEQAQVNLKLEQSRREVARKEWEIVGEGADAPELGRELALREPQLLAAEKAVQSAESSRAQAKLMLGRTGLVAPFNCFVQAEHVDLGQLVSPGSQLATLVGSDAFWVQVSVPVDKLAAVDVPGLNVDEGGGARADVWQEVGTTRTKRQGRVVRLLGDLDPVGRMARLLIEIADPLGLDNGAEPPEPPAEGAQQTPELPILLGAFVHVDIDAREIEDVIELPRKAVHRGDEVYVLGPDGRLEIREVAIAWRKEKTVLVRSGLKPGESVIISRLPTAVPGMKLRRGNVVNGRALGRK